ncbi:hypothetical protein HPB48_018034 [Haemaphysalis longicornis]|uniref:Uncharacterized protein n=1 Tax=Haemaphysalis longicornis TaxID=44386 RepID=A0A9J6F864_HAELO|nr:hypothetical protein HPB48_018034 [Haemaphysalis longicornis]
MPKNVDHEVKKKTSESSHSFQAIISNIGRCRYLPTGGQQACTFTSLMNSVPKLMKGRMLAFEVLGLLPTQQKKHARLPDRSDEKHRGNSGGGANKNQRPTKCAEARKRARQKPKDWKKMTPDIPILAGTQLVTSL